MPENAVICRAKQNKEKLRQRRAGEFVREEVEHTGKRLPI